MFSVRPFSCTAAGCYTTRTPLLSSFHALLHLVVLVTLFPRSFYLSSNRVCTACIAGVADIVLAAMPVLFTAPPHSIVPLGLAGCSLPLCNNVLVTGLIVYRIWSSSSLPNSPRIITQSAPFRAMMLVIESGALYLLIQLIYLVLFALDSPAQATVGTMAIQIYVRSPLPVLTLLAVILSTRTGHRTKPHYRRCRTWRVFRACLSCDRLYVGRSSWSSI